MSIQHGETPPAQPSYDSEKNWDGTTLRTDSESQRRSGSSKYDSSYGDKEKIEQSSSSIAQWRHQSDDSTLVPSHASDEGSAEVRKHDFDLTEMESKLAHIDMAKSIPRPKVTIRSEFPTMTRSTQQQSLTCLVTVEVPATKTRVRQIGGQHPLSTRLLSTESPQVLDAVAADLKARVDNWHGLEIDK